MMLAVASGARDVIVWMGKHTQAWVPFLFGAFVLANRRWWGKRTPTAGQCFRLLLAAFGLVAVIPMWWDAIQRDDVMAGWAQVLGCFAVGWFAIESSWKVLADLVRRSPLPPPPPPRKPPPKGT